MKKGENQKFPIIDQEVSVSKYGAFYHKPICFPAIVDENGIVIPSNKDVKDEAEWLAEHQL